MKKWIALMLAVLMTAALAACGAKSETPQTQAQPGNAPAAAPAQTPDDDDDDAEDAHVGDLIMYQFDKDNMDVDFEDEDEGYTVEDLEGFGEVTELTANGLTFYAVDEDGWITYYFSKEDYKNRLTEVDVTLDNFDQYFEMVEEESWFEDAVEFYQYFRLKDDYLFAMVDYDHLYDNTADGTCRPIDYVSSIDVENQTFDWGYYDTTYEETEVWFDFEEPEELYYMNGIVSNYQDNYIEDNGDGTAYGYASEDLTLTDVSIKFYYLKTK